MATRAGHLDAAIDTRNRFFWAMSGLLLLIVLVGFTPTLYFRVFFEVRPIPMYVHVHGAVLTAWFVLFFTQTSLVAVGRADLHRQLGVAGAVLGAAVLVMASIATFAFPGRAVTSGADIGAISEIVWSDFGSMIAFPIFLSTAICLRRRPEAHKRLMLLASISIVGPALSRISGWPIFGDIQTGPFSTVGLALLLVAVGVYDLVTNRRLHTVTLVGGLLLFFVARVLFRFVIANTEFGRSVVLGLA